MKINESTAIVGSNVVLVPYRAEHVATYHRWMSEPRLRELTASEPLTLEEEYEMQRKWQIDEDKLTFIVLAVEDGPREDLSDEVIKTFPMVGDVNLFLKGTHTDEDFEVEVEIMIAEPSFNRRGFAYSALQLLLSYATSLDFPPHLPIPREKLVARIGDKNIPSLRLFEKLGFVVTKHVEVFGEIEMRFQGSTTEWLVGELRTWN